MEYNLTKDADKLIAVIYKSYLERRKSGMTKDDANYFVNGWQKELLPRENEKDLNDTLRELTRTFNLKTDIVGDFQFNDAAVYYMENRFKGGLTDVLSFIAQFI